ncbi:MAG: hypothetical protein KC572_01035 [Gammaproteobacteria bacterium]|nr:hypothetical protein [Gammaproteobacteria bacterium]
MNHRIGRSLFALGIGLIVATLAFQWITDPEPRARRQAEEQAVQASRVLLREAVGQENIEIVDPLSPNRKVGKVYVYAETPGWAVSGHYRRSEDGRWHPYLMHLTETLEMHALKADDAALDLK